MARDYARVRVDMWILDGDVRELTPAAQHLYFVLLTSPSLSYCGVADWRPGRLAALAHGWTAESVRQAAAELAEHCYIVIDEHTEEVLVRTFIRHDGLMKEARMAVSMVKAFATVASNTIRGVIVHELRRLRATDPEAKGWRTTSGEPGKALALLDLEAIDPVTLGVGLADRLGVGLGVGLAQTWDGVRGSVSGSTSPAPTPSPSPSSNEEEESPTRDDVEALCAHLARRLIANGRTTHTTVTAAWRQAARLLLDRDKRPAAEAHALIDWCQDSEFWRGNIGGMPKFRTQYDNLRLQAQTRGNLRALPTVTATGERTFTAAELNEILGPPPPLPQPPSNLTPDQMWDWEQATRQAQRADRVRQANDKIGRPA